MTARPGFRFALAIAAMLSAVSACAPKPPALPDPAAAARYPDFMFPSVPERLGTPAALERHKAGWLWLQAGDLRQATRNFQASLRITPGFYPAEAGLGYVELADKDNSDAVEHFDRAIKMNPEYVPALVGRGEALLGRGDRDDALKSFEAAVALDASLSSLRSRIEVLRFRGLQDDVAAARKAAESGRLDEARQAYQRALAASPQSPFLLRELAAVERRAGDLTAAVQHAQQAVAAEPTEVRGLILLAELYEGQGDITRAVETYEAAAAIEPAEATDNKITELRETLLLASMPPEFQQIEVAPSVTRAQLAALLGVRLDELLRRAPRRTATVITDTRGNWASPWIISVTRAGFMEVYPNHTFQPTSLVRRADLAQVASRVLTLIAAERPAIGASWKDARHKFPDVSTGHLAYRAASMAAEAGVMRVFDDGSFGLARPVTGAEAVAAVRRLEELAESTRR
jgi:tetratricopeptide (TPR) repeat protein